MCTGPRANPYDFYSTPSWCVDRILERLQGPDALPGGAWLEPGAGNGAIIQAVNRLDVRWVAVEREEQYLAQLRARPQAPEVVHVDFLDRAERTKHLSNRRFAVAFGNPPFTRALRFVEEAATMADTVVMLLRLNFLSSARRHAFLSNHAPDVYVLPNRPSFDGAGADNIEYAWCVWRQSTFEQTAGRIETLALTAPSARSVAQRAKRRLKLVAEKAA